jgi:hypothetical protein
MRKIYLLGLIVIFSIQGMAIPAFARKYKVSCTTCHAPFPRLKAYGAEFAGNGFRMKDGEKERYYVTGGDDDLHLNKDFPIAVRTDLFVTHDNQTKPYNDFAFPWGLKILSGGSIYKNIGYYFYFYISERGEVSGIEDAYIHFNNILNTNFDLMVGQFQISDPLLKRELRLTFEDYLIYTYHPDFSNVTLKYDRGFMFTYDLEKTHTSFVGLLVNGSGKNDFGSDRKADNNEFKNYAFRILQPLPGNFEIGGFFYKAIETTQYFTPFSGDISTIYVGPDLHWTGKHLALVVQYLNRKDRSSLLPQNELKTDLFVSEVIFLPQGENGKYFLVYLHNHIKNDLVEIRIHTLNYTYTLSRNLKLSAEFSYDFKRKKNRMVVGLVTAF